MIFDALNNDKLIKKKKKKIKSNFPLNNRMNDFLVVHFLFYDMFG